MCGIAGVVGSPPPDNDLLDRMAARMAHRGPDSQGSWHDSRAGLAVRRLAVIDLDERSNQPLHNGPLHLAFNGEIYNYRELRRELQGLGHRFETEGDGEVLLHAWAEWEERALDRLNGMFAFAVWNEHRQELVCARDAFGEKPFFWALAAERFLFASEVRPLLEARPELAIPRDGAIGPYLALGVMPPLDQSFFAGIHSLPGAHILRLRDGRVDVRRYWQPAPVDVPVDYDAAVGQLRELLADAIRLRLRADVPVGTSLSGGVDSSVIVALTAQIAGDDTRHAFTAAFAGFERDEWHYADAVARAAGVTRHHRVEPTSAGLLDDLGALICSQEEPFGSSSIYAQWQVMRAARESGVTVLLDGQGADELFAGYPGANGWALRSSGARAVLHGLGSRRDRGDLLAALGSEWLPAALARPYRHFRTTPYAAADVRHEASGILPPSVETDGFRGPLARELLRQTFITSLPVLLRYADRNSMAHGREVRLPYLDRRVAEFALSLPPEFVYRNGVRKAVLRDAARGLVPGDVLDRADKVGYETPQARWLQEPASVRRIRDVLLDARASGRGLYDTQTLEADVRGGCWRDSQGIWRALNLELWLRGLERPSDA